MTPFYFNSHSYPKRRESERSHKRNRDELPGSTTISKRNTTVPKYKQKLRKISQISDLIFLKGFTKRLFIQK
jgi:hypothetical protein